MAPCSLPAAAVGAASGRPIEADGPRLIYLCMLLFLSFHFLFSFFPLAFRCTCVAPCGCEQVMGDGSRGDMRMHTTVGCDLMM
jgi:hypothetical protein